MSDIYTQKTEIENFFNSESKEDLDIELLLSENSYSEEEKVSYKEMLSNIVSINKDYQKLNDTYQDVKKMAKTYLTDDTQQKENSLASKLSRYTT